MSGRGRVRSGVLSAMLALGFITFVRAADQPAGAPAAVDQIEERLAKIESIVDNLAKRRADLKSGMKQAVDKNQASAAEVRRLCEMAGDQTKGLTLLEGQIALLERDENQKAMTVKQRARLAKARAKLDQTPPKMDCSAF